jgi:pilus assembly protein CpaE
MLDSARLPASTAQRQNVLIASHSSEAIERIHSLIGDASGFGVKGRILDHRAPDPLAGLAQSPDLLLLRVDAGSQAELEALSRYSADERPPLIVIGDANHPGSMRAAMQAGARDFLAEPIGKDALLDAMMRLASENRQTKTSPAGRGQLTAFINGKGGSGATFLACNVAHLFAELAQLNTVLLGLDTQFASLPRYLDVQQKRGLLEALDVADDLDGAAIGAYLARHESGLSLLACMQDGALVQQELLTDRFDALLELLLANFDRCVVDVPHALEPFSAHVLERADQIVLAVQQSVPSLHDATRMYDLMTHKLGVPANRITVAVNRYHRSAVIELGDIQRQFANQSVVCIPNDYRAVAESINVGVPIYSYAKRSSVTKSLIQLQQQLGGTATSSSKSFFPKIRLTG